MADLPKNVKTLKIYWALCVWLDTFKFKLFTFLKSQAAICSSYTSCPSDLMTEMMDLSSDVGGPGVPLLDYRIYAERVFFPGQQTAPLSRQLDLPESRRQTVEQGLQQLNNLLNNRLFLTRVSGDSGRRQENGHMTSKTHRWHFFYMPLCVCVSVHPHFGGPAGFLPARSWLRGQPAHHGSARQTGILHWSHEEPAAGPGAAVCCQEPQTHAAPVRKAKATSVTLELNRKSFQV